MARAARQVRELRLAISFRYFGVELLTGLLFLAVWLKVWDGAGPDWPPQAWVLALPYWIMVALFVVATFIDFEHFIIPDEITIGGTVAGVLLSFAIPTLHGQTSNLARRAVVARRRGRRLRRALAGPRLGKLAFGQKAARLRKGRAALVDAPRSGGGLRRRRGEDALERFLLPRQRASAPRLPVDRDRRRAL